MNAPTELDELLDALDLDAIEDAPVRVEPTPAEVDLDALLDEVASADQAAEKAKSVKQAHVVSPLRDAPHAQALQDFAKARLEAREAARPVSNSGLPLSPPQTTTTTTPKSADLPLDHDLAAILDDLLDELPEMTASAPKKIRREFRHWSAPFLRLQTKHRRPAPWRDLSDEMKADAAFLAMRERGPVVGFSVNLRPDTEADALAQAEPADWLYRAARRRLDAALGREVDVFLSLEDTVGQGVHGRRLHLHGFAQIAEHERDAVQAALLQVARPLDDPHARGRQVALSKVDEEVTIGWASYVMKSAHWHRPGVVKLLAGSPLAPRFVGAVWKMTAGLRRAAQGLYESFRRTFGGKTQDAGANPEVSRQSNLTDILPLRNSTYLTAPPNTLTKPRFTPIGEVKQCLAFILWLTTSILSSWGRFARQPTPLTLSPANRMTMPSSSRSPSTTSARCARRTGSYPTGPPTGAASSRAPPRGPPCIYPTPRAAGAL